MDTEEIDKWRDIASLYGGRAERQMTLEQMRALVTPMNVNQRNEWTREFLTPTIDDYLNFIVTGEWKAIPKEKRKQANLWKE